MIEPASIFSAESIARGVAAAKGGTVTKTSAGYTCRCPAHDDHNPSLSISDGPGGKILVHCHAGCSQAAVVDALRNLDLWPKTAPVLSAVPIPISPRGIHRRWKDKTLTRWWEYVTADGEIKGYTARYDGDGQKDVIPYFKGDPKKGWTAGYPDSSPRLLYGLPSLASPGPVWVTEGEKAADAIIRRGGACVSSPGGCKAPEKADWGSISGREVIIWPDFDEPGKGYAKRIISLLRSTDSNLRVVDVEKLQPSEPGWDAADWTGSDLSQVPTLSVADWVRGSPATEAVRQLDLDTTEDGSVRPSFVNICEILEKDPEYAGKLKLNAFSNEMFFGGNLFRDHEHAECCLNISRKYHANFKLADVRSALLTVTSRDNFHPVQDYLRSLRWDGVPRIDSWLQDAFEAENTAYVQAVGKNVLIGAVARVMQPGCKMDNLLILEGAQGLGKTSAVRALAGAAWYAEVTQPAGSTDFYQCLRGKWFVEFGDLAGMRHAEVNRLKQVLSSQADNYRASYAPTAKDHPRHNIFIATTNEERYNSDVTGERRKWPIRCNSVNLDYIKHMRDQLWAEALRAFEAGEKWHIVPDEEAKEEQDQRFDVDPWEYPIARWLAIHTAQIITSGYILSDCIGLELSKHGKAEETRVGNVMKRLGYINKRKRIEGIRTYVYEKCPDPS
jgi:predicted P-loop ATPase